MTPNFESSATLARPEPDHQLRLPTLMRYQRVQQILENDQGLRARLGPRTCAVHTRFGEQVLFSKETVETAEILHQDGRDAQRASKNEILATALRVMHIVGGGSSPPVELKRPEPPEVKAAEPTSPPAPSAPSASVPAPVLAPPAPEPAAPTPAAGKVKKAKPAAKPVAKTEVKPEVKPEAAPAAKAKAKPKPESASAPPEAKKVRTEPPAAVPDTELPPDKRPLSLPPGYDTTKYPHYSVQTSIYSLLLSALAMSEHYERFAGAEERQQKLDGLVQNYLATCDALKLK